MFWHVYNSLNGEQKVIEAHHIASYLTGLHEDLLPYLFLWKEDWPNWKAFLEAPELIPLRKKVPEPPPRGIRATTNVMETVVKAQPVAVPEVKSFAVEPLTAPPSPAPKETQVLSLDQVPVQPPTLSFAPTKPPQKPSKPPPGSKLSERRKGKRVQASLNVIISADGAVFRTLSVDISETGLRLEQSVPASMLKRKVQVVVSSPDMKTKLRFNAQLVGDASDAKTFTFLEPTQAQMDQINDWLRELAALAKNSA